MGVTPLRAAIRPPLVDGLFYPARREALAAQIDDLLAGSATPRGARFAVIAPHAGYEYAGAVMAAAYRAIADRPVRTAVLIGPVHRDPEDSIFLPESTAFSTPLGPIPVDTEAVAALAASDPLYRRNDIPHLEEHCLELQLPFLARLFPGVSIVPLLVAATGRQAVETLSRTLASTFASRADSTVFVVTANMASYMTGRDTETESAALEDLLSRCDWKGVLSASENRKISACGVSCIAGVLSLAGEGCRVQILARARSHEKDEDASRVVHYAAVSVESARVPA
jgi:AmmeMemoRadiSam system protein B